MNLRLLVIFVTGSLHLQIVLSECGLNPCIRQCCQPGLSLKPYFGKHTCQKIDDVLQIDNIEKYEILYESNCPDGKIPIAISSYSFNFSSSGELVIFQNVTVRVKHPNEYCVNFTNGSDFVSLLWCTDTEPDVYANYIGKLLTFSCFDAFRLRTMSFLCFSRSETRILRKANCIS